MTAVDPVRPEYRQLADGFPAFAATFGCVIPASAQRDVVDFTLAMECIDRELDAQASVERRHGLTRAVLAGTTCEPSELAGHVARLHAIARPALWSAARLAFANSERMRCTRDPSEYIRCIEEEGRLTVQMLFTLIGPWCSRSLEHFLRRVAELANLFDKLVDVRGDFVRGEIAIEPGVRVHARLAAALVARVPGALAAHPSWPRLATWGLSYARLMIRT